MKSNDDDLIFKYLPFVNGKYFREYMIDINDVNGYKISV